MRGAFRDQLTRRAFVRSATLAVGSLALSACQMMATPPSASDATASSTTARSINSITADGTSTATVPTPTPFPTPGNVPGEIALAYLQRWTVFDYSGMYDLISTASQQLIARDDFVQRFIAIRIQATISTITTDLDPGQRITANLQHFTVVFDTILVGTITQQNTMTLVVEGQDNIWRVQWTPSLIFSQLSGTNLVHMLPADTPRGAIHDRDHQALATTGKVTRVFLIPGKLTDEPSTLAQLSTLLQMPAPVIKQRYVQSQADARVTIKLMTVASIAPIRDKLAALPGVYVLDEDDRTYPQGKLAAQVIGYVSPATTTDLQTLSIKGYRLGDYIGRSGIELWAESQLAGRRGGQLLITTDQLETVSTVAQRPAETAGTVTLTISSAVQRACEQQLGTHPGCIAVMDVADGSLLALASSPSFDPNSFILGMPEADALALFNSGSRPLVSRAASDVAPPGGTFFPVTVSAALTQHVAMPDMVIDCTGTYTLNNTSWSCWKKSGHGRLSLSDALAQGCDVAMFTLGHLADVADPGGITAAAQAFGLGFAPATVGLDTVKGIVPSPDWKQKTFGQSWNTGDAIALAAGQGLVQATALQVLTYTAAIANGGTLWEPRLVDTVSGPDGVSTPQPPKERSRLPIDGSQLDIIRSGMRAAINTPPGRLSQAFGGLATAASGLTGNSTSPGTSSNAWVAAFAPSDAPKLAVIALLEDGSDAPVVAGPMVRNVIAAAVES